MNISSVGIHAFEGVYLSAHLQPSATAIRIFRAGSEWHTAPVAIFLPVADYERAKRAVEAFNAIMSEPDVEQQPAEAAE